MNPNLQRAQDILRRIHLLNFVEAIRYAYDVARSCRSNRVFEKANPGYELPPKHLAYDAYGSVNWALYKQSGYEIAEVIVRMIHEHETAGVDSLLDWGCGPGRVIRHLPGLLPMTTIYGSDYNVETIDWCRQAVKNASFETNSLLPPLAFEDKSIDFLYACSVFTHLSEEVCLDWIADLSRVLTDNGLIMIWTNGDPIAQFLLPEEKHSYDESQFISRTKFPEGKKMYISFHPPRWVEDVLLQEFHILKHYSGGFSGTEQDVWIARKKILPGS